MTVESVTNNSVCYRAIFGVCEPSDRVKGIMLATICVLSLAVANASGIGYAVAAYRDSKSTGIVCLCLLIFFDLAIAMVALCAMRKKTTYQMIEG